MINCFIICFNEFDVYGCLGFVVYMMVGDGDSQVLFNVLLDVGVDVIELGMFFIDLMVDGVFIQGVVL